MMKKFAWLAMCPHEVLMQKKPKNNKNTNWTVARTEVTPLTEQFNTLIMDDNTIQVPSSRHTHDHIGSLML